MNQRRIYNELAFLFGSLVVVTLLWYLIEQVGGPHSVLRDVTVLYIGVIVGALIHWAHGLRSTD